VNFTVTSVTPVELTGGVWTTRVSPSLKWAWEIPFSPNHTYTGTRVGKAPLITMFSKPIVRPERGLIDTIE